MRRASCWLVLVTTLAGRVGAQTWHRGADLELIRRAVAQRARRDADTLVSTWRAEAHGFLRYASVLDHGEGPVERVIRADELRVEVYGESPNRSKQIITAWRDTTFLPNRIIYHRDHLGIVANDFGSTIRLGQGEEVRDLIHPLSAPGTDAYEFATGDTVLLAGATGKVRVVAVQVRPVDPDSAGTVGTLFLDLDRAALVRFRFTFTPASYRDHTVEDITVTLENALQQNARWLPWRQSIVIRRGVPWLDIPVRTVIRGDWTIDNYQLGVRFPPGRFSGPYIVGPTEPRPDGQWDGPIALEGRGLPATEADVATTSEAASQALGGRLLDGMPPLRLLASGISDFLHVNRVEGVAPGFGVRATVGGGVVARARVGVGLSNHAAVGGVELERRSGTDRLRLLAERVVRDLSDTPVISGVANSVGTLISGDDFGDYVRLDRVGVGYSLVRGTWQLSADAGWAKPQSLETTFSPISGPAAPNPALGGPDEWVGRLAASHRDRRGRGWSLELEGSDRWYRAHGSMRSEVGLPVGALQLTAELGTAGGDLPAYRSFVLGGRGTLPGVEFRSLGGRRMALAEIAWKLPVSLPTPPVPYSRLVRLPSEIAPFLAAGVAGGDLPGMPWRGVGTIEPVAGLRLDLWGPLLRIESGISLRSGRGAVSLDVHPDWWHLM